jgi:hypothetical protein
VDKLPSSNPSFDLSQSLALLLSCPEAEDSNASKNLGEEESEEGKDSSCGDGRIWDRWLVRVWR